MKHLTVSLDIATSSMTLAELSDRLGISASPTSHEKGTARGRKGLWKYTTWRLDSTAGETATIEEHFRSIFDKFSVAHLFSEGVLPIDAELLLNIAVMYDANAAAMCSLVLPAACLSLLQESNIDIEISCYPCSDLRRKDG